MQEFIFLECPPKEKRQASKYIECQPTQPGGQVQPAGGGGGGWWSGPAGGGGGQVQPVGGGGVSEDRTT